MKSSSAAEWTTLAPLPDAIGFGGMFAGELDGALVVGGGSQWTKPIWLDGEKVYSDRIFTLEAPQAEWIEHRARLPTTRGHFACATAPDAIFLAGGLETAGATRSAFRIASQDSGLIFDRLPDLPGPITYAAGAIAAGRFYVVGGLNDPASKTAETSLWSLALDGRSGGGGWRHEPDLPGPGVFVAATGSDGGKVYLFGGMAFDETGNYAPSTRAYCFDPAQQTWRRLTDLPEPRVGAATPCPVLPTGGIFVAGGYGEVFPGAMRDHPGFSTRTYIYNIASDSWVNGPALPVCPVIDRDAPGDPGPAPMIGAPAVVWQNQVVIVSGEVRASVRSPAVLARSIASIGPTVSQSDDRPTISPP